MKANLSDILNEFQIDGIVDNALPYGTGHVNDTFLIDCHNYGQRCRYVLQRINHSIFTNPLLLMNNILLVTGHVRTKLQNEGVTDIERRVPTVILTHDGYGLHQDAEGNYWRLYHFIEHVRSCDYLESPVQAYQAARAFGRFQRYLADLPGTKLHETIPDFHNTPQRLKAFMEILDRDSHNRAAGVRQEIQFVLEHSLMCDGLLGLAEKGLIPERITHNDTKINNVLFDTTTDKGICVIDLDTVMPGLSLYDFGDMVRTATCRAAEDERDLSKVRMDMAFFEQIVRGYAEETSDFLTDTEKQQLVFAGKLITFEQMIRFLGDHLNGDAYYKIHRSGHNLDRARTQMKLIESIQSQEDEMTCLTENVWKALR